RVIGSGTVLDTARFKSAIGRAFDIDARNVHGYIIGEHGDSEIAVYSKTTIGGITFDEYFKDQKIKEKGFKQRIASEVKNAAYEIIQRKGYTNYAVAVAVARICTAILRDERSILTTSSYLTGEYHVEDVYISTPTVIGRQGVIKILEFDLDAEEQIAFEESATIIKNILKASTLEKQLEAIIGIAVIGASGSV